MTSSETPPLAATPSALLPDGTSLVDIKAQMLRVIAGLEPASSVTPWLAAFTGRTGWQRGTVGDVLHLALSSQRLDLLNVVLDQPMFCPVETHRTWDSRSGDHLRQVRLYGPDLFNGACLVASVDRTRTGTLSAAVAWTWNDWVQHHLPHAGAATPVVPPVPRTVQKAAEVWGLRIGAYHRRQTDPDLREQNNLNVVGEAVMMGWPEGVQALLDHGVDPYARQQAERVTASARTFVSPLVLAGHYGDVGCLKVLLAHPSFAARGSTASYGHDEAAWAKLKEKPGLVPWRQSLRHGGLEIEFVLESPEAMQDPVVRTTMRAMTARMSKTHFKRLSNPEKGLSPTAFNALERLVLEQTIDAVSRVQPSDAPARVRARL